MKVDNLTTDLCKIGLLENIKLVDVRSPAEFRSESIPKTVNCPLDKLTASTVKNMTRQGETLCFFCSTGQRSGQAVVRVESVEGIEVCSLEGGVQAWKEAGLPVRQSKGGMSLERQVRIGAGMLVCAGAAFAFFVHPIWIALSAFVGTGLIFAGITDTCMMGVLLARMPWNQ